MGNQRQAISVLFGIAAVAVLTTKSSAAIINVPGDQPTIQAGIDAAVNGDEVVVAPGTYNEIIVFNGKAITVRSSDGPDITVIDATGLFDSVVKCNSGEGPKTILDGFTITGGFGQDGNTGGGMLNTFSSPTVQNCTFAMNSANRGGGMYNDAASPTIKNCNFIDNNGNEGGGMYNSGNAAPIVTDCTFTGNTAVDFGGGMFNLGGSPLVTNCIFEANTATLRGGAIFDQNSSPLITNSLFVGNSVSLINGSGGAIFNIGPECNPVALNCTFASNTAAIGGAMVSVNFSFPVVTNCILWGNTLLQIFDDFALTTVFYSDIEGGWIGLGSNNIDADPLFVDADGGDFRLMMDSPCIDAGSNSSVPESITEDLDGNPRFIEDPNTPDTGCGECPIVDMGAFEFQEGLADCPSSADITGPGGVPDGCVDAFDLGAMLGAWCSVVNDPNPPSPPCENCTPANLDVADISGVANVPDGCVDAFDLAKLLAEWCSVAGGNPCGTCFPPP
ncbi:MAG: hypothetical protein IH983_00660 [Planctomycetes bacterium]|nr:hypothetical protein [Planctomycetota bacterium]